PRPPRPPRPPRAASAAAVRAASCATGSNAATTGLRSSSVDQRRILILTGVPDSATFADLPVRLIVADPADCCCARASATDIGRNATAKPRLTVIAIVNFIEIPRRLYLIPCLPRSISHTIGFLQKECSMTRHMFRTRASVCVIFLLFCTPAAQAQSEAQKKTVLEGVYSIAQA